VPEAMGTSSVAGRDFSHREPEGAGDFEMSLFVPYQALEGSCFHGRDLDSL